MIMWLRHFLGWLRSAFCAREDLIESAGAILGHSTPRERRGAAEKKKTAGSWFHEVVAISRCFVEHRRDVPGGDLWSYTARGFSRGQKSTFGSAGVWTGPRDGTQDVGLFDSAGLPAERASQAAQAGTVGRRDRRDS